MMQPQHMHVRVSSEKNTALLSYNRDEPTRTFSPGRANLYWVGCVLSGIRRGKFCCRKFSPSLRDFSTYLRIDRHSVAPHDAKWFENDMFAEATVSGSSVITCALS